MQQVLEAISSEVPENLWSVQKLHCHAERFSSNSSANHLEYYPYRKTCLSNIEVFLKVGRDHYVVQQQTWNEEKCCTQGKTIQ